MTRATYFVQGPLRAQDGRQVFVVVRVLRDSRAFAVMECLSRDVAQREADALNATHHPQAETAAA